MKKEDILKAAKELFSVYGYKKVSMNEIAEKANVTKKTIYSYFKDKEDLFKQILLNEIENMKTIIEIMKKKIFHILKEFIMQYMNLQNTKMKINFY